MQESDERRKTRWLVGLSAALMIVVVFLWLSYFNTLITPAHQAAIVAGEAGGATSISFWDTMKTGTAVIADHLWDAVRRLGEILNTPRSYIIKP